MAVGKVYVDKKGAGTIYVPVKIMKQLNFQNKDEVIILASKDTLVVRKLRDVVSESLLVKVRGDKKDEEGNFLESE